ncbi:MAG: helicase-related protein [Lawsonibacter sp.]
MDKANKTRLLAHLMEQLVKNALVFTRTKHGANKVARDLEKAGISAAAIHGNKSQTARQQALADFKAGNIRCLVATDIAARGLDIEELSHVFNYNLPEVPETYVHRIGRTGRAGRGGEAIAFCDFGEQPLLRDIEKLIGKQLPVVEDHPFPMEVFEAPKRDKHGRIVNEEDEEARAAAREKRRARDEAAKAAAKEKRLAQQEQEAQAVEVLEQAEDSTQKAPPQRPGQGPGPGGERRDRSGDGARGRSAPARPGEAAPAGRALRHLMDTGDAMPRTEFHRPNPLDSDVIMDATARLLAPRPLTLSGRQEQSRRKRAQKARPQEPGALRPDPARHQRAARRPGGPERQGWQEWQERKGRQGREKCPPGPEGTHRPPGAQPAAAISGACPRSPTASRRTPPSSPA